MCGRKVSDSSLPRAGAWLAWRSWADVPTDPNALYDNSFGLEIFDEKPTLTGHFLNRDFPVLPPVSASNLVDPGVFAKLGRWAASGALRFVWFDLPRRTWAPPRAGERSYPAPLRSLAHPRGRPELRGQSMLRVQRANAVLDQVLALIAVAEAAGPHWAMAHAARSLLWRDNGVVDVLR